MSQNDNGFAAFLAGFFLGGLVGAVASLLLAPQSGEETRTVIRDRSIELKDKAVQSAEDVRIRAEQLSTEARTKAEDLAQQAKVKSDELITKGQQVLEEQKTKVDKAIDTGKSTVQKTLKGAGEVVSPDEGIAGEEAAV